jgi:hypothetical protein
MRDGRAVQQHEIDDVAPGVWPRLVDAVMGTPDLQSTYGRLTSMCPPGWAALGVKAVLTQEADDSSASGESWQPSGDATSREGHLEHALGASGSAVRGSAGGSTARQPAGESPQDSESGDEGEENVAGVTEDETGRDRTILWFFIPLADGNRPLNAVAQEITSEKGHATYVFRLMPPEQFETARQAGDAALAGAVTAAIARLNRALLTLNFRREPIYLTDDQIATGRWAHYRAAVRKLDYLQWARAAFIGRAIHNTTWEQQLLDLAKQA